VGPLGHRVRAIVNYDHFNILPDVVQAYSDLVKRLVDQHYLAVSRYTTSNFLRMKLGNALRQRGVAPHIVENAEQARREIDRS
jgi:propionate CoA-transferase